MENAYVPKRDVFEILTNSKRILKSNYSEMVAATALAIFSIVSLILFPLFGFVLSFFATGFISIGYIKFAISIIKKQKPPIEIIYSGIKQSLNSFALRLVMCLYVILWSLLLVIPGIIAALNYSFAMAIMAENSKKTTFEAIEESKKLVIGYRDVIFVFYLLMFFFLLVIFLAALSVPLIIAIFTFVPVWTIFTIAGTVTLLLYVTFLKPFGHICLVSIYLEAKTNNKKPHKITKTKKLNNKTTSPAPEKV